MPGVESSEGWNERQAENMALDQCDRDNPLVAIGKPRLIIDILRDGCDPQYGTWSPICRRAVEEIERLTAERDQARRLICDLSWEDSKEVARQMGWDCFKGERFRAELGERNEKLAKPGDTTND